MGEVIMRSKPRKSQSTISDRQAMYDELVEKSIYWLNAAPEELSSMITALCFFTVDHEDKTREQLLRILFLSHMKRMIG